MKEIKFRCWDEKRKKFVTDFVLSPDGYVMSAGSPNFYYDGLHETKTSLSQFTGLKDRNGNEIYEDDVVYGFCNGRLGKEYHTKIVKFRLGAFDVWSKFCEDSDDKMDCEIIGNVHEYIKAMGELPPYLNQ